VLFGSAAEFRIYLQSITPDFTFHLESTDEFPDGGSTLIFPKERDAKDENEGDTTSGVIKSTVGVPVKRAYQYPTSCSSPLH